MAPSASAPNPALCIRSVPPLSSFPATALDHRGQPGEPARVALARGLTVYGCAQDEATLFREMAPHFGLQLRLAAAGVSQENLELASGHRCISVGHKTPVNNATLLGLSRAGVEYISTRSVGDNHIDVPYARSVGISVETIAYSPGSVADYTLMLILMLLRGVMPIIRRTQAHDFRLQPVAGKELRDTTVGVVGTGRIGTAVIERLRGFGCRVLAHGRRPGPPADHLSLAALLERSDVVTLHTPLTADTYHLLDRHRIERMRPGAYIVNTARGALLDTGALLDALESGHVGGAALDVLEGEEGIFYAEHTQAPVENRFLLRLEQLPNVVLTPHTAYYTDHAVRDIVESTLTNCLHFLTGARHG